LEDAQSKANTHTMSSFDRRDTIFYRRKAKSKRNMTKNLDELWCDCGKFQKLHLPCSHVLVYHDFSRYNSLVYTLQQVFHVYEGLFGGLINKDIGQIPCPSPDMKRTSKEKPKSSRIRTDMDIKE